MSEFQIAKIFSNHMVLQREKEIHIFGRGSDGTRVCVTLTDKEGNRMAVSEALVTDGSWRADLSPQQAAADCQLLVETVAEEGSKKEERARFLNVAIGEVWLAGGQSNMEFELQNCTGGKDTLSQGGCEQVRFYYTPKESYMDEAFYRAENQSGWELFGSETSGRWSAVGYYFAEKLSRDLDGVTVGIIGCNWGGTSASAWMKTEDLLEDKETASYVEEYLQAVEGLTEEEQIKAYDEYVVYHEEWDKKCGQMYTENPNLRWDEVEAVLGKCQWPGPMNCKNPFRPAGLYQCMLQRICPYSIRGFLYYQGESDDHKPRMYHKLFTRMIRRWREDFLDDTMPFLLVQLTMHRYQYDEDFKNWPLIREAQMEVYEEGQNMGIAVIIDCGEFNNIHPLNKRTVGERLELQALAQIYGKLEKKQAFGPVYKNCERIKTELKLHFSYAEEGFVISKKSEDYGFEIAGEDKAYVPATVRIDGPVIYLSAKEVPSPKYARYLWTNYGEVSVFGANGLPLAPFRTSKEDEPCDKE